MKYMDCLGCGRRHKRTPAIRHMKHPETGKDGWFCEKWFAVRGKPLSKRIDDMSPAEYMSGVHLGAPKQNYGKEADTTDFYPKHKKQVKALRDAL